MNIKSLSKLQSMYCLIPALIILFAISSGCEDEVGLSSEFAIVSGTITFDNVVMWPDSGIVMVTLWQGGVWGAQGSC